MAKNLREAYKEVFKAMYADALEISNEANATRAAAKKALDDEREKLARLEETVEECRGNFVNQGRLLKASARSNQPLELLKEISDNIQLFVSSKEEIPDVEEKIAKKGKDLSVCESDFIRAVNDVEAIRRFLTAEEAEE